MLDKLTVVEEVEPCCDDCANNEIAEEKDGDFW